MKSIPIRVVEARVEPITASSPAPTKGPWRLATLMSAPHRLAFASGSLMLIALSLWWFAVLTARAFSVPIFWSVPMPIAHAIALSFGFLPLFFVGFLFTAGPKWLFAPATTAREIVWSTASYLVAFILFLVMTHANATAAIAAITVAAMAWTVICYRFKRLFDSATADDRTHARWVFAGILFGAVALWTVVIGLAKQDYMLTRLATQGGIWLCMALVYVVVAHRMIPFFTANVVASLSAWRPMWVLYGFNTIVIAEFAFAALDVWFWPMPSALRITQAIFDGIFAVLILGLALRWGLMQSLRARLLAMLHVGFLWFGIALTLFAVSRILLLVSDGAQSLGLAPMHALTMGFMGATLVAMATRVTAGHSGRRLVADDFVWRLFWLQQLSTVLRIVAAVWPNVSQWLTPFAASLWATATVLWAARHLYWYGLPRADGKPG